VARARSKGTAWLQLHASPIHRRMFVRKGRMIRSCRLQHFALTIVRMSTCIPQDRIIRPFPYEHSPVIGLAWSCSQAVLSSELRTGAVPHRLSATNRV